MNITLQGKRALVTGGNSGIGAAIALALAEAGAKVAINHVCHPKAADVLVKTIKKNTAKRFPFWRMFPIPRQSEKCSRGWMRRGVG